MIARLEGIFRSLGDAVVHKPSIGTESMTMVA